VTPRAPGEASPTAWQPRHARGHRRGPAERKDRGRPPTRRAAMNVISLASCRGSQRTSASITWSKSPVPSPPFCAGSCRPRPLQPGLASAQPGAARRLEPGSGLRLDIHPRPTHTGTWPTSTGGKAELASTPLPCSTVVVAQSSTGYSFGASSGPGGGSFRVPHAAWVRRGQRPAQPGSGGAAHHAKQHQRRNGKTSYRHTDAACPYPATGGPDRETRRRADRSVTGDLRTSPRR
jgi:hypothetical protein